MAFSNYETSRILGQPVMLYQFVYGVLGDGVTPLTYDYTDHSAPVEHAGVTYQPLPIRGSSIKSSGKLDDGDISLRVPRDSQIADLFRIYPPGRVVTVTIRQGHIPNPDDPPAFAEGENFPVVWLGRVLEASREEIETTLTCEAASASMRRAGLRRHYQWPCPLVLYGSRCNANRAAATTVSTVSAITSNEVLLVTPWRKAGTANADYTGGLIEWTSSAGPDQRAIKRVRANDWIVLSAPAFDLDVGDTVNVILGCPHTLAGCESLHNNVVNYGGQPYIPTENPIGKNSHT